MERRVKIFYTSDVHGYLLPINYGTGEQKDSGLFAVAENFEKDGNTLMIDGGDTIQGSPFTMYTSKKIYEQHPVAEALNLAGYDYVTLGNHDFNYGEAHLGSYLETLSATCLCSNVADSTGKLPIKAYDIKVLENGLRIGMVGAVTDFVNVWEQSENIENLTISDPFVAVAQALEKLKEKVDVTICVYHGGFECDLETGTVLSQTTENVGYRICKELDFDLLLSAHQHMPVEGKSLFGTHIVQPAPNGEMFLSIEGVVNEADVVFTSTFGKPAVGVDDSKLEVLYKLEAEVQEWLDQPVGFLDRPLLPESKVEMALNGSAITDFFNQVQLEVTGADLSCTSLANEVKGFDPEVTVRDVVSTYIYPNTLCTTLVTGTILKAALERVASYLELNGAGEPEVSRLFLHPKVEHYNFDFFAGVTFEADLRKPVGERISNVMVKNTLIKDTDTFTLCMNNYRVTGAGGYEMYEGCPLIKEEPMEMSELIINYLDQHRHVKVTDFPKPKFVY